VVVQAVAAEVPHTPNPGKLTTLNPSSRGTTARNSVGLVTLHYIPQLTILCVLWLCLSKLSLQRSRMYSL
jgi:hypothetical protein